MNNIKRAVVLLSGGLDSATVLAIAKSQGYECFTMSFDYGQRHRAELDAASSLSHAMGAELHKLVTINLADFGGSALTDERIDVPVLPAEGIPVTYVPARNTVFLSLALAWSEVLSVSDIFIGVNAVDYSGYPDCRPDYIAAFEVMANLATRQCDEGGQLKIRAPLINMSKAEIITKGSELGVDYSKTVSCYQADQQGRACGVCDSCRLRRDGFVAAGVTDSTKYQT